MAADKLRSRIGQMFDAEVTGVTDHGTYVRLQDGSAEGRVVRGEKDLTVGQKVRVKLVNTDSVHGTYTLGVCIDRLRVCAGCAEHNVQSASSAYGQRADRWRDKRQSEQRIPCRC